METNGNRTMTINRKSFNLWSLLLSWSLILFVAGLIALPIISTSGHPSVKAWCVTVLILLGYSTAVLTVHWLIRFAVVSLFRLYVMRQTIDPD